MSKRQYLRDLATQEEYEHDLQVAYEQLSYGDPCPRCGGLLVPRGWDRLWCPDCGYDGSAQA